MLFLWLPLGLPHEQEPGAGNAASHNDPRNPASRVKWTPEEEAWLSAHPEITIAVNKAWPPMDYVDEAGRPDGIGVGFIRALNRRLGDRLKIVPLPWEEMYSAVKEGRLDALMDVTPTADRKAFFHFTKPYLNIPHSIIVRKGSPYHEDLGQLSGKSVGVERKFFIEKVLREKYPDIKVELFDTTSDALDAVSKGLIDAYVGNRAVAMYLIERELIHNLAIQGKIKETSSVNAIGIRKDQPLLKDILEKALDDLDRDEIRSILNRWVDMNERAAKARLVLSAAEEAWLRAHPNIVAAFDNDYAPYSFRNEKGELVGIAVDVAQELAERIGLRIIVHSEGVLDRICDAARKRQVDVVSAIVPRPEHRQWLTFTRPYLFIVQYVVTRKDSDQIQTREDIAGRIVALVQGHAATNQVLEEFPTVKPYEVKSVREALDAVSTGKADAAVTDMGAAEHIISLEGMLDLRFAAFYGQGLSDVRFGVRNDWPELAGILDKALESLTEHDRLKIFQRWTTLEIARAEVSPRSEPFELTASEKTWLQEHRDIRIAIMKDWPPLNFVDKTGKPCGIGVDFVEAINLRLNGALTIETGQFESNLEQLKRKEIDAIMDVTPTDERRQFYHFTVPYLTVPHVLVGRRDGPYFKSEKDLEGKTVALEQGFNSKKHFQEHFPKVRIREYPSTSEALEAVSRGEADAYAGNRAAAAYLIERELFANLRVMGRMQKPPVVLCIGVRHDWPVLAAILDRAIASITTEEARRIHRRWLAFMEDAFASVELTPKERAWLRDHPVLRLGYDPEWPPVEYLDKDGRLVGISADFIERVKSLIGIEIRPTKPQSWRGTLEEVKKGTIDILFAAARTPQRESILIFSEPYLRFPMVIVTAQGAPYIANMKDLREKKVAVVQGNASHDILAHRHPELDLLPVENVKDGLHAVLKGAAHAFIDSLAAISHVIGREGLSGVKVSGETPYSYHLSVAVTRDQPILAEIVQKALNALGEEERNAIFKRWISVTFEGKFDYTLLWRVVVGALLVIAAVLYWNRRLAREIQLRRKMETELMVAKQAAESANRVKSAFLAAMSHELRTPLNSIIGFTGILLNEMAGPLNLEQKKQLKMVKGSSQHLLNLINDVLDISKIEAGEAAVTIEVFKLPQVIEQVVESLRPSAVQKGLYLITDIAPGVASIRSDERRVRQILINLVNNAVKFTEKGGVRIQCRPRDTALEVRVTDTGIGIREEDMAKLFKPFQQLDSGTARRYEGTGLGLSVCKRILDLLGGSIWVESTFGEGSTFAFTLPLNKEEADGREKDPGSGRQ